MNNFSFPEICRLTPADEQLGQAINKLIESQDSLLSTVESLQKEITTLKSELRKVSNVPDMPALSRP